MNKQTGKQSLTFEKPVYVLSDGCIAGKKEGEGPLGDLIDKIAWDDCLGGKNWEDAESRLQQEALGIALEKAKIPAGEIRYLFAGDLLAQGIATSFGLEAYEIPLFGLYGACSTCGLSLGLGSMAVDGGYADKVICVTSSHFASAEKEFRFPLAYGSQRPLSATWTVTGSGAFVLGKEPGKDTLARITGITTGRIVDFGVHDSMNMGACMAPAAADVIARHLEDFGRQPEDYDKIFTGDLGTVGQTALIDLLKERGYDISAQHMDCGIEIYDAATQDTHAGGSGCGCSAVVLAAYVLPKIAQGIWKRVLFVPTGALLSKVSYNEGNPVAGIAHAIVLEVV